jgi:hypothetical protein
MSGYSLIIVRAYSHHQSVLENLRWKYKRVFYYDQCCFFQVKSVSASAIIEEIRTLLAGLPIKIEERTGSQGIC